MTGRNYKTHPLTQKEKKERAEQSARDKAAAAARRKKNNASRKPMIWTAGSNNAPTERSVPALIRGKNIMDREAEAVVKDHLLLDRGVVLPRLIPTYVQPHLFRVKKNIRDFFPHLAEQDQLPARILMICRADVEKFLSIGAVESDTTAVMDWDTTHTLEADFIFSSQEATILCFDENLHLQGKSSRVVASTASLPTFRYFKSDKVADGVKYYPGVLVATDKVFMQYNITNPDQADMEIVPTLTILTGDPSNPQPTTIFFDAQVAVKNTTTGVPFVYQGSNNVPSAVWNGWFNPGNTLGFSFGFRIANAPTIGRVPSGLRVQIYESQNANLVHAEGIRWTDRSLFTLLDDAGTLRNQYYKADSFSVTGASLWLENVTAKLYQGGSITAAQLPGGSESNLPTTASQMESFIRRQKTRVLDSNALAKGLFWTFIPEKVQDVIFEPTGTEHDPIRVQSQKPYLATVLGLPQSDQASPEFVIDLRLMLEYITQEIDSPSVLAPSNVDNWLEKYYGELAKHKCITENPEHFKHFVQVAKKVVTSPMMQEAGKTLVRYGIKALPLLASAVF